MSVPHPDKHMQTRCGRMVERGHIGYPCSRPMGHAEIPPDDPEPCYAIEVPTSLRAWQAWSLRQQDKAAGEQDKQEALVGQLAAVHQRPEDRPVQTLPEYLQPSDTLVEGEFLAKVLTRHCGARVAHEPHLTIEGGANYYCDGFGPDLVPPQDVDEPVDEPQDLRSTFAEIGDEAMAAPTRTRPEDQVLPDGDLSLVDDQTLLIADIRERMALGIKRYGQTHRPFNGRNTMQDAYEEAIDRLVYERSLLRLREVTRKELATVILEEMHRTTTQTSGADFEVMAEMVSHRLADWAIVQKVTLSDTDIGLMTGGPTLEETDPDLVTALRDLIERYGALGVMRTVQQIG